MTVILNQHEITGSKSLSHGKSKTAEVHSTVSSMLDLGACATLLVALLLSQRPQILFPIESGFSNSF